MSILREEKVLLSSSRGKKFELSKTASPVMNYQNCIYCGECIKLCPTQAATEKQREVCKICPGCAEITQLPREITEAARKSCSSACPVGMRPQAYNAMIFEGRFSEAFALMRHHNPFAATCGYICPHFCEDECKRKGIDEVEGAVAIGVLHRFAANYHDKALKDWKRNTPKEKTKERVAIVGSGPAGLTAAYHLARRGYRVTIFEVSSRPGGMLISGIPKFRLPRQVVQQEIDAILALGIEIKYEVTFGKEVTLKSLMSQGYKAIFVATGAQSALKLDIDGKELSGIDDCISFMGKVNQGEKVKVQKKALVIGGGDVALDVARALLRLGAKEVGVACLEAKDDMPAHKWEIQAAEEEGIIFHYSLSPVRFYGTEGVLRGVEFVGVKSIKKDADGKIVQVITDKSKLSLKAGTVIVAVGQSPDTQLIRQSGLRVTAHGTIEADSDTLVTNIPGVFAGGDVVTVEVSVVQAIAAGQKAATAIDDHLRKRRLRQYEGGAEIAPMEERILPERVDRVERCRIPTIPAEERKSSFKVVELEIDKKEATKEAERCLQCGYCSIAEEKCLSCEVCSYVCPQRDVISLEALT